MCVSSRAGSSLSLELIFAIRDLTMQAISHERWWWRELTLFNLQKKIIHSPTTASSPTTTSSYFFASVELCKLANKNTCLRGTPCSYNCDGVVFAKLLPRRKNPSTNPPTSQWKQVVLLPQESLVKTVVDFARSTRYYCTCTLKHSHVPKESKDVLWN